MRRKISLIFFILLLSSFIFPHYIGSQEGITKPGAPKDATYITKTPNGTLTQEQALSALSTGIMKVTTGTGVISVATAGTDYVATEADPLSATKALDNLASVAINTSLISGTAATDDLGTEAIYWKKLYLGSDISFEGATDDAYQTTLTAVDTTLSDKSINMPDASGTMAVSATIPVTLSALGDIGVTVLKDLVTTAPLTGGTNDILVGADADITIAMPAAATDANGYLTSTDWNTFNGKQAALTFGIADTNKVQINAADVADNDYAKFTATGLEGRSYSEVLSDIGAEPALDSSAGLLAALNDETGTGLAVFNNSPTFVDDITLGLDGTDGTLKIYSEQGATDYLITFQPNAAMTGNTVYTLPPNDGDGTQLLQTDGSGGLTWVVAGTGDITSVGNVASGAAFDGTQGTIFTFYNASGNMTLTYDGTTLTSSKFITGNLTGNVTGNLTGNADTVTVADAGGDTTMNVGLWSDASGSLVGKTDAGLTFNANTNALTFLGDLINANAFTLYTTGPNDDIVIDANSGGAADIALGVTGDADTIHLFGTVTADGTVNATTFVGALTGIASGNALPALSNLASVACNLSLVSDTANTDDLGTEALYWKKLYIASDISFEGATDDDYQTTLTAVDTTLSDKSINIPNASGTMAVSATAPVTLSALGDVGLTVAKDIVAGVGLSGGEDNVLPGADADTTLTLDTTEVEATTWGAGGNASNIWTFNGSGTDTTITFGSALVTFSHGLTVSGTTTLGTVAGTIDAGGATSFEVPNGANPTTDAAGEIAVDSSAAPGSGIRFYGDAAYTLAGTYSKSFVILNPVATDDYPVWCTPYAITIKHVRVQCLGGTNVVAGLDEYDAEGINPAVVDSADITATANNSVDDDGILSNPTIDALDYVGFHVTSISGTPTSITITFDYVIDQVN